jgi:sodium transport system permease protein
MFQVYKKELLELLRDKKTLFFVIALPLMIFPVLFGIVGLVMANAQIEEDKKVHRYVIIGQQQAPKFSEDLFYHKSFEQVEFSQTDIKSITEAIGDDKFDVAIIIPANYQQLLKENKQSEWQIVFNDAVAISKIYGRIKALVDKHSALKQTEKFTSLGVPVEQHKALIKPIVITKVDTADKRENLGEKMGGLIPYLLIPICLMGAIYPAIDLGAGEKERGTLETLLLTPLPRTYLVLGKFFTILTTSLLSAMLTVGSLGLWAMIMGTMLDMKPVRDALGSIGAVDLSLILLLLVPLSCMFASLMLAISIYARSFKEAQNYMGPLNVIIFLPLVGAFVPGVTLNWNTIFVPIMNVALAIKEIIKGTVDYTMVGIVFALMTAIAVLMLGFSIKWFSKEEVLFR